MKSRKLLGVFMVLLVFGFLVDDCASLDIEKEMTPFFSPQLSTDKLGSSPEIFTSESDLQDKIFKPISSLFNPYMPTMPNQENFKSASDAFKHLNDEKIKPFRLDELGPRLQLGKYFPRNYVFDYNEYYRYNYTPNYQTPHFVKPNFQIPDTGFSKMPDFQIHDFKITDNIKPDLQIPKIQKHDIQIPKQSVTEITIPSQIPNMKVHDLSKQYIIRPNLPKNKVPMF